MNATKDKNSYEIRNIPISKEPYGLGMRKGDTNFVNFVNKTLLAMEKSGESDKIYRKWFPGKRFFKITDKQ